MLAYFQAVVLGLLRRASRTRAAALVAAPEPVAASGSGPGPGPRTLPRSLARRLDILQMREAGVIGVALVSVRFLMPYLRTQRLWPFPFALYSLGFGEAMVVRFSL